MGSLFSRAHSSKSSFHSCNSSIMLFHPITLVQLISKCLISVLDIHTGVVSKCTPNLPSLRRKSALISCFSPSFCQIWMTTAWFHWRLLLMGSHGAGQKLFSPQPQAQAKGWQGGGKPLLSPLMACTSSNVHPKDPSSWAVLSKGLVPASTGLQLGDNWLPWIKRWWKTEPP